jgi:hypothetical protein
MKWDDTASEINSILRSLNPSTYLPEALRGIGWAVSRPQQAIFQGAKAGADTFGEAANSDNPQNALLASIPAFMAGAAGAFDPRNKDVTGRGLAEGLTGNEYADAGVGSLLDVLADPLAPLLGALGKPAGTMARTVPNLMSVAKTHPNTYGMLDKARGWKKWLMDIPVAPENAGKPVTARMKNVDDASLLRQQVSGDTNNIQVAGFNTGPLVAYAKQSQERTLPHELVHYTSRQAEKMPRFVPAMEEAYDAIRVNNPRFDQQLASRPAYMNKTPVQRGEEMFARVVGDGRDAETSIPALMKIAERARSYVQPEMYRDAARLPLEVLSGLVNTIRSGEWG